MKGGQQHWKKGDAEADDQGAASKIGTFSDALMAEAKQKGWIVISMRDDWKTIFPFKETKNGEDGTKHEN
jgi:hypothetical protein